MSNLMDRITIDLEICHGKPCIRGLRYPVESLLELLAAGMTTDQRSSVITKFWKRRTSERPSSLPRT